MFGSAEGVIDPARPNEERVGEAVHVDERLGLDGFAFGEGEQEALGAARDRARLMAKPSGIRAAGMDEVVERRQILLAAVDRAFERARVLGGDARHPFPTIFGKRREIGPKIEEDVLRPGEPLVEFDGASARQIVRVILDVVQRRARQADDARDFVDRPVCVDARCVFLDALTTDEPGRPRIARLRIDSRQLRHATTGYARTVERPCELWRVMASGKPESEQVPPKAPDLSTWYNAICYKAELVSLSPVRGCVVLR